MLSHLSRNKRLIIMIALALWLVGSVWSAVSFQPEVFAALGSFALCISFGVFLSDRYVTQGARRQLDAQALTQSRMMWRYFQDLREGASSNDPTPIDKLRDQITQNFDSLLAAKADEKNMESYGSELTFTIVATLQWGFGNMFLKFIHGGG